MQRNCNLLIGVALSLVLAGCASAPVDTVSDRSVANADAKNDAKNAGADSTAALSAESPAPLLLTPLSAPLQQAYTEALAAQMAKQWRQALHLWKQLSTQLPTYPAVWYNLAVVQFQLQQADEAQQSLQQLLTLSPNAAAALNLSGVIAKNQGQFRYAERQYLAAIAAQADNAVAHKNVAFLDELYLDNPAKAREHYERYQALTADPQVKAWLGLLPTPEEKP